MTDQITVMFRLDATILEALQTVAADSGGDVGDVVRGAIRRDLFRRSRAKKAVRADEQLVAPLRVLLAKDIAEATGWGDLSDRLNAKGFEFREAGAGLALYRRSNGQRLAKASDIGTSYGRLMRRFNAPMPGHSHSYLFERLVDS